MIEKVAELVLLFVIISLPMLVLFAIRNAVAYRLQMQWIDAVYTFNAQRIRSGEEPDPSLWNAMGSYNRTMFNLLAWTLRAAVVDKRAANLVLGP